MVYTLLKMIKIIVEDRNGEQKPVEIPEGINLSLMEVLKASDYDVLATCGGIALCATCHVEVLKGFDQISPPAGIEFDMLDTLHDSNSSSRLSCQVWITEKMEGMVFRIKGE